MRGRRAEEGGGGRRELCIGALCNVWGRINYSGRVLWKVSGRSCVIGSINSTVARSKHVATARRADTFSKPSPHAGPRAEQCLKGDEGR